MEEKQSVLTAPQASWLKRDVEQPLVISKISIDTDTLLLELVTSRGELYSKEIAYPRGKAYTFLYNTLGSDIRLWQGRKLWFGEVGKYFLPVKAE